MRNWGITICRQTFLTDAFKKEGNPSVLKEVSGFEKFYATLVMRGYHDFSSAIFCLRVPKIFVGLIFWC